MLRAARVEFVVRPADLDERALEAAMGDAAASDVALALAEAKARAVFADADMGPAPVLGGDSLVEVEGRRFAKARSREEAAEHLRFFSDRVMHVHSAAAIARAGQVAWRHVEIATLKVRPLSDAFIAGYLNEEWPAATGCVGVFRIEALGVQLFEAINGDHFTIRGMPLLAVLGALRDMGLLPE